MASGSYIDGEEAWKAMIYKKQGSGFSVYSVGSNRKDDEGRVTWEFGSLVTEKDDDWTWNVASK